jgi:acyl carrier protein
MKVSSAQIATGLRDLFPECVDMVLSNETILGELPEWDSMAAVNLQSFLHQAFDIEVPLELLADETRIQEICDFLDNPVDNESAW